MAEAAEAIPAVVAQLEKTIRNSDQPQWIRQRGSFSDGSDGCATSSGNTIGMAAAQPHAAEDSTRMAGCRANVFNSKSTGVFCMPLAAQIVPGKRNSPRRRLGQAIKLSRQEISNLHITT